MFTNSDGWNKIIRACVYSNRDREELGRIISPLLFEKVVRPFNLCPYEHCRVVIMDDMIDARGTGVSYSVTPDKGDLPIATNALLSEYYRDLGLPKAEFYSFEEWAAQGVLMLNYHWTRHHSYLYDRFAYRILRTLALEKERMAYLLPTKRTRKLAPLCEPDKHLVVTELKGSKFFSRVNDFFPDQPIYWRLR